MLFDWSLVLAKSLQEACQEPFSLNVLKRYISSIMYLLDIRFPCFSTLLLNFWMFCFSALFRQPLFRKLITVQGIFIEWKRRAVLQSNYYSMETKNGRNQFYVINLFPPDCLSFPIEAIFTTTSKSFRF